MICLPFPGGTGWRTPPDRTGWRTQPGQDGKPTWDGRENPGGTGWRTETLPNPSSPAMAAGLRGGQEGANSMPGLHVPQRPRPFPSRDAPALPVPLCTGLGRLPDVPACRSWRRPFLPFCGRGALSGLPGAPVLSAPPSCRWPPLPERWPPPGPASCASFQRAGRAFPLLPSAARGGYADLPGQSTILPLSARKGHAGGHRRKKGE